MKSKIAIVAGIVYFNPNRSECEKPIRDLEDQVDYIIVYDNTCYHKKNMTPDWLSSNTIYLSENENRGIAYALNRIMEKAKSVGAEWVVTFDQDSEIPENFYSEYKDAFDLENVGIVCSQVLDERRRYMRLEGTEDRYTKVPKCITSASCTKVEAWEKVGKYDEKLFIDLVDNDFSKRIRYYGYDVYRANRVVLKQQLGVIEYKDTKLASLSLWLGDKLNNKNIAKLSYKKKVSPLRIYYTNRNVIYLNKRHKFYGGIGYESYYCKNFVEFYIVFNLASILRSDCKLKIAKAVIRGTIDGIKLRKNAIVYKFSQ